jgi:hypothetical protein
MNAAIAKHLHRQGKMYIITRFLCMSLILMIISIFLSTAGPLSTISSYATIAAAFATDTDGDGILDDGDNSGVLFDNPCTGGETADCDDNCLEFYNPEQIDDNSDGNGDLCECEGDFEADGDVDGVDLTLLLEHFGRSLYYRPCIPADPCMGDFDNDFDVDGDDVTVFLEDFGRNKWFLPCPPCFFGFVGPPPPPPENPPDPRFIDHGDGTVTDNLTGLMWTKDAQQIVWKYHWDMAVDLCESLIYPAIDGYDDWRLPSLEELQSLIDANYNNPPLPLDHPFQNIAPFVYWTSTPYPTIHEHVHYIFMTTGNTFYHCKAAYGYIWPVRNIQ